MVASDWIKRWKAARSELVDQFRLWMAKNRVPQPEVVQVVKKLQSAILTLGAPPFLAVGPPFAELFQVSAPLAMIDALRQAALRQGAIDPLMSNTFSRFGSFWHSDEGRLVRHRHLHEPSSAELGRWCVPNARNALCCGVTTVLHLLSEAGRLVGLCCRQCPFCDNARSEHPCAGWADLTIDQSLQWLMAQARHVRPGIEVLQLSFVRGEGGAVANEIDGHVPLLVAGCEHNSKMLLRWKDSRAAQTQTASHHLEA